MMCEGIVLCHRISSQGIKVNRAKIETVEKLPPPTSVKGLRSFLGHASFYRRFIKDECLKAFILSKEKLVSIPIVVVPN